MKREQRQLSIEGHTLVARLLNPDIPGTPIILLHGITASIHFWTPDLIPELLRRGPCYALSLPGHYPAAFPSGFRPETLTADLIVRLLTQAIQMLVGEQPVLLVGHSTGGFAALAVAAAAPEMAQKVISVAGFAQGQWAGALGVYQGLARRGAPGVAAYKALYKAVQASRGFYSWSARLYAGDPQALYAYEHFTAVVDANFPPFQQLNLDSMAAYFRRMPDIDIIRCLPAITAPTLVLTGDSDPIVPPAQARLIANRVPHADLAIIPGAGHFVFAERPGPYHRAIETWLGG